MTILEIPSRLAIAAPHLRACNLPEGAFDPDGAWSHAYAMWCLSRADAPGLLVEGRDPYLHYYRSWGGLRIRRIPSAEGARLEVDFLDTLLDTHRKRERARVECSADALGSARAWQLDSRLLDGSDQPVEFMHERRCEATREAAGLRISGPDGERTMALEGGCTTLWGLFDAVQRRPADGGESAPFAFSEDLRLLKPDHTLAPLGRARVELANGEAQLEGFALTGRGSLPWEFWRTPDRRLVLAASGIRFFMLDGDDRHVEALS